MANTEGLGDLVRLAGFKVPDLLQEPHVNDRRWFTVAVASGRFAVRAFSEVYAILKAEIRAEKLRKGKIPVEIGSGLPLVMQMEPSDAVAYESTMFGGKSEAELESIYEPQRPVSTPEEKNPRPYYNPDQIRLFEPYKF